MKSLSLSTVVLMFAVGASAQVDGNPDNWCREGFFTRDSKEFRVARIKGQAASRAYFHKDDPETCPDSANCQARAYLVPGDNVITNRARGQFVCAWYTTVKGSPTVGWLKQSDLEYPRMPSISGVPLWLGQWKYAGNVIEFTDNKLTGFVNVTGNAIWKGIGDNVHVGELDGRYSPKGGVIEYSDGDSEHDCRASLRLVGPFLVVADNMNCGGANVSFSGVYVKSKR
jgi:hypothetical protein